MEKPLADGRFDAQKRVVIEDIQADERYAIHRAVAEKAGFRAVQSTPLCSRDGKPLGMLTTQFRAPHAPAERELRMLDLCGRQAADFIERLRITERLQDADRRKDEFIATLSHELRNPLAAIDSSALLLESPDLDVTKRKLATQVVQRQCKAMKILLDDLLDISRLSLGRMTLHKQCVTLASVIDSAVEITQPLIDGANHTLSVTKPPSSVVVYGDPIRLSQIFSNLLSNAVKYTDPGGRITLDVKTTADGVAVSVTDNGIGIEPSLTEEIFGMFSQTKTSSDRTIAGLGIGLALVRAIAELHGGWARAESNGLGQGSIFHVGFPLATAEEIASHASLSAASPASRPHPDHESHVKMHAGFSSQTTISRQQPQFPCYCNAMGTRQKPCTMVAQPWKRRRDFARTLCYWISACPILMAMKWRVKFGRPHGVRTCVCLRPPDGGRKKTKFSQRRPGLTFT